MRYQAIAVLAAGALVVAGCSTADDPDDTASPLPTAGEQTPTETPGEAVTLDDTMLLPPEQMPAWNNAGTWVEVDDTNFWRVCTLSDPLRARGDGGDRRRVRVRGRAGRGRDR